MQNGLYERENADGTIQICCTDCDRWIHKGTSELIRHSSRCDTPNLQPTVETEKSEGVAYDTTKRANALSGEELVNKVRRGYLTQSEAMNTDF